MCNANKMISWRHLSRQNWLKVRNKDNLTYWSWRDCNVPAVYPVERFPPFNQGMNDTFHDLLKTRPSSLFLLFGCSSVAFITSLMICTMYWALLMRISELCMMLSVECMFYKTLLVQLSKAGLGLSVPSGAHKWAFTAFPAIMTVTPVPLSGFL